MTTDAEKAFQGRQITLKGLFGNLALGFFQLGGSFAGKSHALFADAIHTFSDCLTDIVVYTSLYFSYQPADHEHPYGHGKIETLATTFVGVMMVIAGGHIALSYLNKFLSDQTQTPTMIALFPALLCLSFKEFLFQYQHARGKKLKLPSLIANAWHHRSDALSSIVVLIGITGSLIGISNLDILAGIIVALMICGYGLHTIYRTSKELIETSVSDDLITHIEEETLKIEDIKKVRNVRARHVGSRLVLDLIIHVDGSLSVREAHEIADQVENNLMNSGTADDVIVHIEPL